MNRASRFIEAFKDRVAQVCPLKVGDTLTITNVSLGQCESSGEEVKVYVNVECSNKYEEVVCLDNVLFDPEYTDVDFEYRDQLAQQFELEPAEIERRLKEADLCD